MQSDALNDARRAIARTPDADLALAGAVNGVHKALLDTYTVVEQNGVFILGGPGLASCPDDCLYTSRAAAEKAKRLCEAARRYEREQHARPTLDELAESLPQCVAWVGGAASIDGQCGGDFVETPSGTWRCGRCGKNAGVEACEALDAYARAKREDEQHRRTAQATADELRRNPLPGDRLGVGFDQIG